MRTANKLFVNTKYLHPKPYQNWTAINKLDNQVAFTRLAVKMLQHSEQKTAYFI